MWIIVPFVLVHLIIAHKEIRFLFPILGFLPFIVTIGSNELLEHFALKNKFQAFFRKLISFGLIVNFIVLSVVCFRPMTTKLYLFQKLYAYSSKPTVLYCLNAQPYLDIQYYRSNQMVVKEITSLDEIKQSDSRQSLLLTNSNESLSGFSSPILTTYPSWLKNFNFGHWMYKSESYNVYSIKK
jgi:phosphatidylinositol glycan class B